MHTKVETSIISHEIARRLLLKQSMEDISQAMAIELKTLQAHVRRGPFKALLDQLQSKLYRPTDQALADKGRNLKEEINLAAIKSFDRLTQLLEAASSEAVVMHVAQDMLDRAGYAKKQVVETEATLRIDPIDAGILMEALATDKAARERIKQNPDVLKGTPHPLAGKIEEELGNG